MCAGAFLGPPAEEPPLQLGGARGRARGTTCASNTCPRLSQGGCDFPARALFFPLTHR